MKVRAEEYLRLFVGSVVSNPRFSHAIQQIQLTGGWLSGNLYVDTKVSVLLNGEVMFCHSFVTQEAEGWLYKELPGRILENLILGNEGQLRLFFSEGMILTAYMNRNNPDADDCWIVSSDQLCDDLICDRESGFQYEDSPLTFDQKYWWIDPVPENLKAILEQHPEAILLDPPAVDENLAS